MPNQHTPKRKAVFPVGPSIAYVPLTRGFFALVDREHAESLTAWNWCVARAPSQSSPYAVRAYRLGHAGSQFFVKMHSALCPVPNGMVCDHKNGNTLDNRKSNLRAATPTQNSINARKKPGAAKVVGAYPQGTRYYSRIKVEGVDLYLGTFSTAHEAHTAYMQAAKEHHGEYTRF